MKFEIGDYNALRAALARMCAGLAEASVPEGTVFDSKLVANELVINALRYGGGRAYFSFRAGENGVRISVRSEIAFRPPETVSRTDPQAERGRGLYLVDMLAGDRDYSEEEGVIVVVPIKK